MIKNKNTTGAREETNKTKKDLSNKNKSPRSSMPPKGKFNPYWIYGIIFLGIISFNILDLGDGAVETDWGTFKNKMLLNKDVKELIVIRNEGKVEIYLKENSIDKYKEELSKSYTVDSKRGPQFFFIIGSIETFDTNIQRSQESFNEKDKVIIKYEDRKDILGDLISWFLPILVIIAIWMFFFRRMNRQVGGSGGGGPSSIFSIGKSKARLIDEESNITITFKDVAGLVEAKEEIEEIVDFLQNPKKYTQLGGKIPKGALLIGPPGTGKTLLAKAVAGEANVPFFSISGSDFVEMFVGVGASRVRDLFRQAKSKSPCIIFIDEIDAVGRARGKNPNMGANDERENTLNQLLTEMDGFDTNSGVIVLAATNRSDILDRALMRAGRFDRQINVDIPDLRERKEIFQVHLRPLKVSKQLEVEFLAKQTPGFSGADIANVCNEAALIAARKDKKKIEKQDFLDAVDRIIGGLEKKNKVISANEKEAIAIHEAGHASVSWVLEHAHPLVKVTIVPRGNALGAAWYLPKERQITTYEQILDEMCSALAGRAAEELIFGKISTGALNDLEKVTKQAYAITSYFGMGKKLGNISFYDSVDAGDFKFTKPYSEKTAEIIDEEVKKLVENQYKRAKSVLSKYDKEHKQLAELLLEREVIFNNDLEKIFGKRKFQKPELKLSNGNTKAKKNPQQALDL